MNDHLQPEQMEVLKNLGASRCDNTRYCYYEITEYSYYGNETTETDSYGGFDFYVDGIPSNAETYDGDYGYSKITKIMPVFSLSELLERFPKYITKGNIIFNLRSDLHGIWYEDKNGIKGYSSQCTDLIDSAFYLYIYLLTNNDKYEWKKEITTN